MHKNSRLLMAAFVFAFSIHAPTETEASTNEELKGLLFDSAVNKEIISSEKGNETSEFLDDSSSNVQQNVERQPPNSKDLDPVDPSLFGSRTEEVLNETLSPVSRVNQSNEIDLLAPSNESLESTLKQTPSVTKTDKDEREPIQKEVIKPAQTKAEITTEKKAKKPKAQSKSRVVLATPRGLEDDVKFWEGIFSKYDPDQCVFHDEWELDVVYEVARIPRMRRGGHNSQLRAHLSKLRGALNNLASSDLKPVSAYERKILKSIPERHRNYAFLAQASDNLRCQRGVDFSPSMQRSENYIGMIKKTLREKKMPEDIAYLPHLESGFHRRAVSHAGAAGLWQFMKHTARSEGLKVNSRADWRYDPLRATDAATDHLASMYRRFGSWELAITSYNYGPNGMARAVKKFGPDYMTIRTEHKTRIFGFAARNYYPSFLAARNVAKNYHVQKSLRVATDISKDSSGENAL
jgi:soluble lytic murein transglycosylase-like protein